MEFTAEKYVDDVLNGEQVACRWVRLACERHRRDLERAGQWVDGRLVARPGGVGRQDDGAPGIWFDVTAAKMAIAFFSVLRHSKGEWAGKPIKLEGWQQFSLWCLFGWKRADGTRRFRTGYLEVGRKNGKSTLVAGVGLMLLMADGESGAEIYTLATKESQAKIIHSEATRMVLQSPELKRELRLFRNNINHPGSFSKYEPLGSDSETLDGLNVHVAIADEVHAWKNRDLWDVMDTATGSRRQPLMLAVTTAGFDRQSLCWQLHDYLEKVLLGVFEDDSFFGLIFTLDGPELDENGDEVRPGDNWEDEGCWVKANPNLGVSKYVDDLRRKAERVKHMPAGLNNFLRKELNVWTQAADRWISPERWRACGHVPPGLEDLAQRRGGAEGVVPFEEVLRHMEGFLRGRRCYGALDLSSNIDLSCWLMVFPPEDDLTEPWWVLPRFFLPEDNLEGRVRRDRVPYDVWERGGLITLTPGNIIDYDFIVAQVDADAQVFDIEEVGYDRWGATGVMVQLQELGGVDWVVPIGQGFASMAAPMKELERLILGGLLGHGGHPVLSWMADNVVVVFDAAGNMKMDKSRSREKIDGMVALVMGVDRAVREEGGDSVYEDEDLLVL